MRHMVIYWENESDELHLLDDVATMCCGNDGHEFIVSDVQAAEVREIVTENLDKLVIDADELATTLHIGGAFEFYGYAHPRAEADIQAVLRILGIDDYSEITSIIEAELTDEDCRIWHSKAEATKNTERLMNTFGAFQIWGVRNPRDTEEPLSVIWSA